MEIVGKIIEIKEEQAFESGFRKRDFLFETEGSFPQKLPMVAFKEVADRLAEIPLNTRIEVKFNLRGSEWNHKHYVNLQAWQFTSLTEGGEPSTVLNEDPF